MKTMEEQRPHYYIEDDEITLKELILKLREFRDELLKHKLKIILAAVLVGALFLAKNLLKAPEYKATLTFMVDDDSGGSAIGGVLSKFGFGGSTGEYNLQKILALSKSMRIAKEALLDTGVVEGKTDLFANHIIDLYKFSERKSWKDPEKGMVGFRFGKPGYSEKVKNIAIKSIFAKVVGGKKTKHPLYSSSTDEDTGIMTLSVKSKSPDLSLGLVKSFYKHLSEYYVEKSTEKAAHTYEIVKAKADSIRALLNQKEYALAKFKDANRGIYLNKIKTRERALETEIAALRMAWGEALKNKEMADYSLKEQTPFIQPVDVPFPPIRPIEKSMIKDFLIGAFLGGFLISLFFIIRKIILGALS